MAKSSESFTALDPVQGSIAAALRSKKIGRDEVNRLVMEYSGVFDDSLDTLQDHIRRGNIKLA
jgi:hypothetical protein